MSSTVIPGLRYHDAANAVDWLRDAFGFEKGLVVTDDDGSIPHAQLHHGTGMVMIGSARNDEYGSQLTTADVAGGPTVGLYVIVDDVAGHADTARAAGADIFMGPEAQDYGGSSYSCRDFEGNIWSFGDYNPWTD